MDEAKLNVLSSTIVSHDTISISLNQTEQIVVSKEADNVPEHGKNLSWENFKTNIDSNISDNVVSKIIKNCEFQECGSTQAKDNFSQKDLEVADIVIPSQTVERISGYEHFKLISGAWDEFSPTQRNPEVFLKGCKWSPDGTCLLTNNDDAVMRLFDLPLRLYNCYKLPDVDFQDLKPSVKSKIGGLVYDYDWYPLMTSTNPDTCCFITTSFCAPVQMWDAYSGTLRCSYRGYNAQDELHAALSATFNPLGDLVLCGYKDSVKVFHTDVPGRDFITISTKELCDQKGIVSCLAVNPNMPNIFAAGTYTKTVGLYSVDGHALCLMTGQGGGLTQLMFTGDGSRLLTAGRKDSDILCWDLRQLGSVMCAMQRPHSTNQRIYFDLSPDNQYLLSGSSDGNVYMWDLHSAPAGSKTSVLKHQTQWHAHNDCVNGLSIHRHIPVVATASGQRHIPDIIEDDDDSLFATNHSRRKHEDSIKLWWTGDIGQNGVVEKLEV